MQSSLCSVALSNLHDQVTNVQGEDTCRTPTITFVAQDDTMTHLNK